MTVRSCVMMIRETAVCRNDRYCRMCRFRSAESVNDLSSNFKKKKINTYYKLKYTISLNQREMVNTYTQQSMCGQFAFWFFGTAGVVTRRYFGDVDDVNYLYITSYYHYRYIIVIVRLQEGLRPVTHCHVRLNTENVVSDHNIKYT